MARDSNCKTVFQYTPNQSQRQQHPPQPNATGAKATYLVTKVSNLSHCKLNLRCSCTGDCAVAPAQCHVSYALHVVLRCGLAQHIQRHTTYHPWKPLNKHKCAPWRLHMQLIHYFYTYTLTYACQLSYMHDSIQCRCSANCSQLCQWLESNQLQLPMQLCTTTLHQLSAVPFHATKHATTNTYAVQPE